MRYLFFMYFSIFSAYFDRNVSTSFPPASLLDCFCVLHVYPSDVLLLYTLLRHLSLLRQSSQSILEQKSCVSNKTNFIALVTYVRQLFNAANIKRLQFRSGIAFYARFGLFSPWLMPSAALYRHQLSQVAQLLFLHRTICFVLRPLNSL